MNKKIKVGMERGLEYFLPFVIGVVFVCGILVKAGTISSGYHFRDDHELIRFEHALSQGREIFGLILDTIQNDFYSRFRPMYWVCSDICVRRIPILSTG